MPSNDSRDRGLPPCGRPLSAGLTAALGGLLLAAAAALATPPPDGQLTKSRALTAKVVPWSAEAPVAAPLEAPDPGAATARPADGVDREAPNKTIQPPGLLPVPKMSGTTGLVLGRSFDGRSENRATVKVPDVNIAVGRASDGQFVVQAVNTGIAIFDRNGTSFGFMPLAALFGAPGLFDPRITYDPYDDRFVLIAVETFDNGATRFSFLHLAVSETADPTGNWLTLALPAPTSLHYDFPDIGFDPWAYYAAANLVTFPLSSPSLWGVGYRLIEKPKLVGGVWQFGVVNALDYTLMNNGGAWAMRGVRIRGLDTTANPPQNATAVFLGTRPPGFGFQSDLRLVKFRDPLGTPFRLDFDVPLMPGYSLPVVDVPQNGSGCFTNPSRSQTLDVLSSQLSNAEWREGSIWTAHAINDPFPPAGIRNLVQWYEIQSWPMAPPNWARVIQQGTVVAQDGDDHAFFPSIAVNEDLEVALVFAVSGPNDVPSVWVTGRSACDAPGAMAPIVQARAGQSCYNSLETTLSDPNRWGDYFGIAATPGEPTFWATGEYASAADTWNTHIQELTVAGACPTCSCTAADVLPVVDAE